MPQIQGNMIWSYRWSRWSSRLFGPQVSLPCSIALWTQASYTLPHILSKRCLVVSTCKCFLNFPRPHNIWQQWHCHSPTRAQHNTYVAESCLRIKHRAVHIYFSHSSSINGPILTLTHEADIVWVGNQSLSDAIALLVDSQHTLWALDVVVADTLTADSTWVLAGFLEDVMSVTRYQELGFLHVDTEPFTFHARFPFFELGRYTLPVCPWWAPGHPRKEAPKAHLCGTHTKLPPAPG